MRNKRYDEYGLRSYGKTKRIKRGSSDNDENEIDKTVSIKKRGGNVYVTLNLTFKRNLSNSDESDDFDEENDSYKIIIKKDKKII